MKGILEFQGRRAWNLDSIPFHFNDEKIETRNAR